MHLFLTFSAALGNMSKLYCTRLHENWLRFGIIQVNLASALALHKRSFNMNDFVKPKDQREFIRFGLARNRTFKNPSLMRN